MQNIYKTGKNNTPLVEYDYVGAAGEEPRRFVKLAGDRGKFRFLDSKDLTGGTITEEYYNSNQKHILPGNNATPTSTKTVETSNQNLQPINSSLNASTSSANNTYNRFIYPRNVNTSWFNQPVTPIQQTNNQFDKFSGYNNYSNYQSSQNLLALLQYLGIGGGSGEGGGGQGGSEDGPNIADFDKRVDEYIDSMIETAGGRRDLIIKELDANHKLALGTDDQARARFLEKVASKLEERIGRIPYDYEKYTTRELEDFAKTTERLTEGKDTALGRLYEDEKLQGEDLTRQAGEARDTQGASLTERGLLEGTRENAQGMPGEQVGKLEDEVKRNFEALARATGRDEYDINTGYNRGITDALGTRDRNLSDITTTARRGGIDAEKDYSFGKEKAEFDYDAKLKELKRQRELGHYASATGVINTLE